MTVIEVRESPKDVENLNITVHDRLAHDGASALRQSAAVSGIRKSGRYGFDPVIRGFKYDQLNIVVNGVPCAALAACPNRMDPPVSQVAPNMMDRVEVYMGPHSFRYGTGLGGTVNYITRPPQFSDSGKLYGRASGGLESNGLVARTEGALGYSGKVHDITLLGSFSQGDDYLDGADREVQSAFQRASGGATLGFKPHQGHEVSLSVTHNRARDTEFPALPMDLRWDKTWLTSLRHTLQFRNKRISSLCSSIFSSFVYHLMDNFDKSLNPRTVDAQSETRTMSAGGRSESEWLLPAGKLYAGIDVRMEQAEGARSRSFLTGPRAGSDISDEIWNGARIVKPGIFAEYRHDFEALTLTTSGRLEVNDARANEVDAGFAGKNDTLSAQQINPSISIGAVARPGKRFSVGVWLGRAQRSGGLTERYVNSLAVGNDPYELLGNPDLNAEINNQIDLTAGYATTALSVDLTLFAAYLQDYISSEIDPALSPLLPSSPGVRRFTNIDKAFKGGFECRYSQKLVFGLQHALQAAFTYGQDLTTDSPLPEIAPADVRYRLCGRYIDEKLHPEVSLRYVFDQDRISSEFGESRTASFFTVDLAAKYWLFDRFGISCGVNNLFDIEYHEHLSRAVKGTSQYINAEGRTVFAALSVDFM